jgi:hypothetical protein
MTGIQWQKRLASRNLDKKSHHAKRQRNEFVNAIGVVRFSAPTEKKSNLVVYLNLL